MAKKRREAVRVEGLDGLHAIIPYVMPKRSEAEVCLQQEFDVTDLLAWMKERNEEEGTNLKIFHAVCTAVGKTVYHRPLLNRFISGRYFWQRNDITLSFLAKRQFADGAAETIMCMKVDGDTDIYQVSKRILGDVTKMRKDGSAGLDGTIDALAKMPRWLLTLIFWVVGRLEYHGIMPASLAEGDSNYSTVLLSNLGSIGGGAPYHHLNDYGTNSFMIVVGTMQEKTLEDGSRRTYLPMAITLDERIGDGFYFTRSLKYTEWLLAHPDELAKPMSELGDYDFDAKKH